MKNEDRVWCVHLPNDLKRPTKIQSAVEGRQMYRIIEQALRDYLITNGVSLESQEGPRRA